MTKYERPKPVRAPDKSTRKDLLRDYVAYYATLATTSPGELNVKLPRSALEPFLDEIGIRLSEEAERLSQEPGAVRTFLDQNPLPAPLRQYLPDSFRAFCLILNSLKQWVVAEQAATDRYLLGGNARDECRAAATKCIVTGEPLGVGAELHHPVRDGRPPVFLSKDGHERIEGQMKGNGSTESVHSSNGGAGGSVMASIRSVKRNESWKQLRRGCLDQLGRNADHSTRLAVQNNARAFARRARDASGLTFADILAWLDENELG